MTAHKLAQALLKLPDIPVAMVGAFDDCESVFEVSELLSLSLCVFRENPSDNNPKDVFGLPPQIDCIALEYNHQSKFSE